MISCAIVTQANPRILHEIRIGITHLIYLSNGTFATARTAISGPQAGVKRSGTPLPKWKAVTAT